MHAHVYVLMQHCCSSNSLVSKLAHELQAWPKFVMCFSLRLYAWFVLVLYIAPYIYVSLCILLTYGYMCICFTYTHTHLNMIMTCKQIHQVVNTLSWIASVHKHDHTSSIFVQIQISLPYACTAAHWWIVQSLRSHVHHLLTSAE